MRAPGMAPAGTFAAGDGFHCEAVSSNGMSSEMSVRGGVKVLRHRLAVGLVFLLCGCTSERQFAADTLWPFGNPNAPQTASETAQRALGKTPGVTPIAPQAGDVWPGAVQPMPTL